METQKKYNTQNEKTKTTTHTNNKYNSTIHWPLFYKILKTYNIKSTYNTKYSFFIKLIHDNLPTMNNLFIRRPDLYQTDNCISCKEQETPQHLLNCQTTSYIQKNKLTVTISKALYTIKPNQKTQNIQKNTIKTTTILQSYIQKTNLTYFKILFILIISLILSDLYN